MRVVADFLGVDPTSPHMALPGEAEARARSPSTPPRKEFQDSPATMQFHVHTPTHAERRAMELTVIEGGAASGGASGGADGGADGGEGERMGNAMGKTMESTMESVAGLPLMGRTMEDADGMGIATRKYVDQINAINGDATDGDPNGNTFVGGKNTMGMTKQWQTLESIAL